jgi:hypothetical protein
VTLSEQGDLLLEQCSTSVTTTVMISKQDRHGQ